MERETRRFRAVSNDGGAEFTVIEYRSVTEYRDLSDDTSIGQRHPRFALTDGSSVNQIDPETFKIVRTDQIIRKVR
jgi:hypothetical protein